MLYGLCMSDTNTATTPKHEYIIATIVPGTPLAHYLAKARWDVPARHQGQTVEVSYHDGPQRSEADEGAEWRRTVDRSTGQVIIAHRRGGSYYR